MMQMPVAPLLAVYPAPVVHDHPELVDACAAAETGALRELRRQIQRHQADGRIRVIVASTFTTILPLRVGIETTAPEVAVLHLRRPACANALKREEMKRDFLTAPAPGAVLFLDRSRPGRAPRPPVTPNPGCSAIIFFEGRCHTPAAESRLGVRDPSHRSVGAVRANPPRGERLGRLRHRPHPRGQGTRSPRRSTTASRSPATRAASQLAPGRPDHRQLLAHERDRSPSPPPPPPPPPPRPPPPSLLAHGRSEPCQSGRAASQTPGRALHPATASSPPDAGVAAWAGPRLGRRPLGPLCAGGDAHKARALRRRRLRDGGGRRLCGREARAGGGGRENRREGGGVLGSERVGAVCARRVFEYSHRHARRPVTTSHAPRAVAPPTRTRARSPAGVRRAPVEPVLGADAVVDPDGL